MIAPLLRHILVATDFSTCAAQAWDYGIFLAGATSSRLTLMHVLEGFPEIGRLSADGESEGREAVARRQLEEALRRATEAGVTAQWAIDAGIPSQQITTMAKESNADLVVLGTHGRTALEHVLLGSTVERVVKTAACPVLVIRSCSDDSRATPLVRRILAAVDFSVPSLDAVEYAARLAEKFNARLTLVHVLEPLYYDLDLGLGGIDNEAKTREQWKQRLTDLADRLEGQGVTVSSSVRGGIPADSILAGAKAEEADLIVMGTQGRRGSTGWMSGSVAESVLRQASCPVFTVRTAKFPAGFQRLVAHPIG